MATTKVQAQWRGFVRAIGIACLMAGLGMWSLGWMDKDVARIGSDLLKGARHYLGVSDQRNAVEAPPRPGLFYGEGGAPISLPGATDASSTLSGIDAETYEHAAKGAMVGQVKVIDGNRLTMNGHAIRFWGVDVPDVAQLCTKDGRPWRCGSDAAHALTDYVAGRLVACYEKGVDANNVILGQCFIGQIDVNGWLARNGWAFAYRRATSMYGSRESMAKFQRIGIWHDGGVEAPWEWRKHR